jgi:NAD(P)-dependent dehydrogenase (short-subunit alcohol dehydrogenase family)
VGDEAAHGVSGKVVVVTGATSGVGRAATRLFAERGDAVGIIARGRDGLDATLKDIESAGAPGIAIAADVSDTHAVEDAACQVEDALGPIDVWVNNAMVTVFSEFMRMTMEEFERVTNVTYLGQVYGTNAALARMVPRDRGVIVNVGSALAYRGIPLQTAYCGAKHAIQGFTESLRCELMHRKSHVRITMVQLPGLNTPQFDHCEAKMPNEPMPVPPIYQPEVAARAIVWAADHPRRRETWVAGTTFGTLIANKVAAGLLDRYLARTNFKAQQRPTPLPARRPSNLWHPVAGDPGAHGDFDDRAHARSAQWWLDVRRGRLLAAAAAGLGFAAFRRR